MTDELLGRHGEIVDDLLARLQALQAGDTEAPRVVVLRGPSGTGKSRIVRELYGRLRDAAPEPGYWPPLAGVSRQTAAGADPMAARKEIAPPLHDFVWPSGAVPTFGWWGFNCERLSTNAGQDVVAAAAPQLEAHLTPLLLAWRRAAGLAGSVRAHQQQILATVRDAAIGEGSGALLAVLESVGIAVPFAGTLVEWGWKGTQALNRRLAEQKALRSEIDLGQAAERKLRSAGADLAGVVRSVTNPQIPNVVVIEDMHLMGPELTAFINAVTVADPRTPVLVVGTVWPEGFDNTHYAAWLEDAGTRDGVQVVDVPPLDEEALVSLLRWYAPATSDEVAHRVVARLTTPHALKLWLTLGSTSRSIARHDGKILLDATDSLDLPTDVEQILLQRWQELPERVRQALLIAVTASPLDDPLARFVPSYVVSSVDYFDTPLEDFYDDAQGDDWMWDSLEEAALSATWCRTSDGVSWFTEQDLAALVRRQLTESFTPDDIRDFRFAALVQALEHLGLTTEQDGLELGLDSKTVTLAEFCIASVDDPSTDREIDSLNRDFPLALPAAAWVLARSAARRSDFDAAVELGYRAIEGFSTVLGADDPKVVTVRTVFSTWTTGADDLPFFQSLLLDLRRLHDEDHGYVISTRVNIAVGLLAVGRESEGWAAWESLLADVNRMRQPDDPLGSTIICLYGIALSRKGRSEEAIVVLEPLLARLMQLDGSADRGRLLVKTQRALAEALSGAGHHEDAVAADRDLLARQQRLGAEDPDLFATRADLGRALLEASRLDEAFAVHDELLSDQLLALGPEHPDTLETRGSMALLHATSGRLNEAISAYELLVHDRSRLFGSEHPDTLSTRISLAGCLGQAGRGEEQRTVFQDVIDAQTRTLGPSHPETLSTRAELALLLDDPAYDDATIKAISHTLTSQAPKDLGALQTEMLRGYLALLLEKAGRYEEAITPLERSIKSIEGSSLPAAGTFPLRLLLAQCLDRVGRTSEALDTVRSLVADQEWILGPDHPATIENRALLSEWTERDEPGH